MKMPNQGRAPPSPSSPRSASPPAPPAHPMAPWRRRPRTPAPRRAAGGLAIRACARVLPERALTYAGLKFAVTKAVISNRVPDEAPPRARAPRSPTSPSTVSNPSKDTGAWRAGRWELKLADGISYRQPYSDVVDARDKHDRRLTFPVPAGCAMGRAPRSRWTRRTRSPRPWPSTVPCASRPIPCTSRAAARHDRRPGHDVHDPGRERGPRRATERAPLGKRCLHLSVRVTDDQPESGDQFLPSSSASPSTGRRTCPST